MFETAWYRSLYWRIGIGFVVFLIAVLALQAGAMFWLISRMDVAPGPPPPELTRLVARDLGEALAEYEHLAHEVQATEDGLRVTLFGTRPAAEVVLARIGGTPVGFAVFFHNYSTFVGRPGLYL